MQVQRAKTNIYKASRRRANVDLLGESGRPDQQQRHQHHI
jgi:hypothetical protein